MATVIGTRIDGGTLAFNPASITAVAFMSTAELSAMGVSSGVKVTIAGVENFFAGTVQDFYALLAGFYESGFGYPRAKRQANIAVGPVAYASIATDAAGVAGTAYESSIDIALPQQVTGIGVLNGTVVGTDNVITYVRDGDGLLLANSALAGTLGAGADTFQEIPFVTPVRLPPGRYIIGTQFSGGTHATQRIAASTYLNAARATAGVFGTIPAQVTALNQVFTAGAGPIGYFYE